MGGDDGDDGFAWEPLEEALPAQQGVADSEQRRIGTAQGGAEKGQASWRTGSWQEVAEGVKELKHAVGSVRAEIKGDLEEAAKDMREIKAQLSQLVYRATKQVEQREREAISATAATLLLEQDGPPAPKSGRKSASRAATPDEVDGWTENELPLVNGPLSPASRLRADGTESPPRPRSRAKSPPRSPTRKGAAPWVNTEVDGAPGSPDPDGPDGIDGGRFPRLPMSPQPPRLARPPSAESGPKAEPTTQSTEDPYGILGRLQGAGHVSVETDTAAPEAAAATAPTAGADGDAQLSTRASERSVSPSQQGSKSPLPATLTQVTVGEQVPEHWGFPDQFFDSLPRPEAGGATSNMLPVTTGGYEFRPNLGAAQGRDSFGGGAQPYLERDIAIITRHQLKEHERRARSRLQSRQQRRERRHREENSSRHEHMGNKPLDSVLRLPRTPPHSGDTLVGGEPIAPRPSSVSSMSHTPDTAALANLAIVPRPSSRGARNTKFRFSVLCVLCVRRFGMLI